MKILAISDVESKSLWEFYTPEKLQGVDLVLSCGDLDPRYLSFLATFTPAPVLYVHGNHDTKYKERPPEGCECIEDKIYRFRGVRILGLGGSMRYKLGPNQYTPQEMERRLRRMRWKLWRAGGGGHSADAFAGARAQRRPGSAAHRVPDVPHGD